MLIDGEKYACEACVRGHRVSNCNHYERPLTHINKKGRPVSQCPHCRGLRKARSSHVKCECGDKGHKPGSVSPKKDKCACGHGQRCTCAIKKDHLAPINELKKPAGLQRSRSHTDAHKPRSSPMHAEAPYPDHPLTVFQNGHHKPVHHLNHAAHDVGMPYKIPRPHSIHGNSSLARASTDSLPLLSEFGNPYPYEFMAQEDALHHSAHNSPALKPKVDLLNQLPQLDLSYAALNTDISSITSSPRPEEFQPAYNDGMGYFSGVEPSAPLSAMSGPPMDLSAMDLQGNFGGDYTQPAYPTFEGMPTSHPGMTSSSSGDVSETEDYINAAVHSPAMHSPAVYANSPYLAPQDPNLGYNVSSDSIGNLTPPSSMPTSGANLSGTSMDQLLGSGVGSPIPQLSPDREHEGYAPHFTLQEAQKRAHPGLAHPHGPLGSREASRVPSPPQFRPTSDPSWASPFPDDGFMPGDRFQAQAAWGQ